MLNEQDLQLARLRNHPDDHNLNAFNPNYGCESLLNGRIDVRSLPQVPRERVDLLHVLGRGAFGEVFQGNYRHRDGEQPLQVAVKILPSMSTKCSEEEFIMEASIMAKFSHPNIVHMIGVCFDRHPRYLVIELLDGGDLKRWLRESRGLGLTMKDLMFCALDVAKGCRYMESRRFIHRDIAARNCLLSSKGQGRVVKIADFGMARDIYRQDYYKKGGRAMLPIKWMPPEAFLDGIFTAKTDVWSYGVLIWEIFSQGIMPYASMSNAPVMKYVTNNFRLPQPAGCPNNIYALMQQTWSLLPENRPTFSTIIDTIVACTLDAEIMNATLPEFMRVLKMSGDNGTELHVPYNPEECERPEVENAEDDPQDYLVPLDAQRRRAAVAHAAAIAAARIGGSSGGGGGGGGGSGSVSFPGAQKSIAIPSLPMPMQSSTAMMVPATPTSASEVPFICSDPHCTNTNHILPSVSNGNGADTTIGNGVNVTTITTTADVTLSNAPPAVMANTNGGAQHQHRNGSIETSFSIPKSVSNPGDLLPPPPPPVMTTAAIEAIETERRLINLETPQATPTAIKPPMAFGDRDSSCNSIATITLDPACLEQQHMSSNTTPYMNIQLRQSPPVGDDITAPLKPVLHQQQQQQQPMNDNACNGNGNVVTSNAEINATIELPANGTETTVAAANVVRTGNNNVVQEPFTIHGFSKRYKPNENHSEISC